VNLHRGTPVSQRPARQNSTKLPQTGNQDAVSAASLGLMGLALAGGLAGMKKRHE
ncbi:MAG: LPXTG cell wall anchor domain-containing protein, partial [Limosilactobacillus pontis]